MYTGSDSDLAGNYPEDHDGREEDDRVSLITHALTKLGCKVDPLDFDLGAFEKLRRLKPDLAFNICDCGFGEDSDMEPHIPAMLDILGIRYTGSNYLALALCLDKMRTKEILSFRGLPTPKFHLAENASDLDHDLHYPIIVKPSREDGSIGIKADAVATDAKKLKELVSRIIKNYKQPAIIEEFISGSEFTVVLLGNDDPRALPINEFRYPKARGAFGIMTYESKWQISDVQFKKRITWTCPAMIEKGLEKRLVDLATKAYRAMGLRGYGRVDLRMDGKKPMILEVNANPDLDTDCFVFNSAKAAGMSYKELIKRIVEFALE